MRSRWTALVLVVLVLVGLTPRFASAQSGPPQTQTSKKRVGGLGQNYPNPFNPTTTIPFTVGEDYPTCSDKSKTYVVSLVIVNVIAQPVAVPIVQQGIGRPLKNLKLTCGAYDAYWNGFYDSNTRQRAASGMYVYILTVDGHSERRSMRIAK